MTQSCVSGGQLRELGVKYAEVLRRVAEGTLTLQPTMAAFQRVIEGEFEPKKSQVEQAGMQKCGVFSGCRCTICGGYFADGDDICANGHEIGCSYEEGVPHR